MPFEIVPPNSHFDFVGKWKICMSLSAALIVLSLAALPVRGFRLGIDFAEPRSWCTSTRAWRWTRAASAPW